MRMTQFDLKLFAISTMLIDHVGALLFPEMTILRVIGRLSFPVFAYLISIGYEKTGSFSRYLGRLLIFAAISQIPFSLAFERYDMPNVLFTLSASLLAMRLYDDMRDSGRALNGLFTALMIACAAEAANADWGFFGVALPLVFHINGDNWRKTVVAAVLLTLGFDSYKAISYVISGNGISISLFYSFIHMAWFPSLLMLRRYCGERGGPSASGVAGRKALQLSFYAFYPLHLLVLHAVSMM